MSLHIEVIREAARRFVSGFSQYDDRYDFETIIWERWPARKGGVGFSHGRTRDQVRRDIANYYEAPYAS